MAQLNPRNAIFSPSVARLAASTAKDWSFVDGWLRTKYQGGNVPQFERNSETLKALLALASHSESADEERDQLAQIKEEALTEITSIETEKVKMRSQVGQHQQDDTNGELLIGHLMVDDILGAIQRGLSREGETSLDAMANMALELGVTYPSPELLGAKFVELQSTSYEVELMTERVDILQRFVDSELRRVDRLILDLQGEKYKPDSDLAKRNLELQRAVKTLSARLPDLSQQLAALTAAVGLPVVTVDEVKKDEEEYLDLLRQKKDLDAQVKAFRGLPPDIDTARAELEALRMELRKVTDRRDAIFEGLVERESPVRKPRRP